MQLKKYKYKAHSNCKKHFDINLFFDYKCYIVIIWVVIGVKEDEEVFKYCIIMPYNVYVYRACFCGKA